ncbi:MAG TPA: NUDIX hydrolase [Lacunisphaera sp.]|jgi:8-oxo-dGTP pyrophosphatase MutT (NUDIX family)
MSSEPKRWLRLRSESHSITRIFDVKRTIFRHPDRANEQDFFVINAPDWVNVIALTSERRMILVKQFRYGINDFSMEIPGGVVEQGEDFLAAGVRELREETGYVGNAARLLGSVHPNPAIQNNRCHLVLVENVRLESELEWDPDEELEVLLKPADEVYALAYSGGITHALVLNALLLFWPHWAKLREGAV